MNLRLWSLKTGSRDFSTYDSHKADKCMDQEGNYKNCCAFKEGQLGMFWSNWEFNSESKVLELGLWNTAFIRYEAQVSRDKVTNPSKETISHWTFKMAKIFPEVCWSFLN